MPYNGALFCATQLLINKKKWSGALEKRPGWNSLVSLLCVGLGKCLFRAIRLLLVKYYDIKMVELTLGGVNFNLTSQHCRILI